MKNIPAVVLGTAIGDALGMPFENKKSGDESFLAWNGDYLDSDSFHNLKAGQWTDDTGMTVALTKSIIRCNGFDPENVAKHYLDWGKGSYFRGAGRNTREALKNLESGLPWTESGKTDAMTKHIYGSGPSMRVAPIGLFYRNDINKLIDAAQNDAIITHNAAEPQIGAIAVALGVAFLANKDAHPETVISKILPYLPNCMVKQNLQLALRLFDLNIPQKDSFLLLGNEKSTGYLIHTNVATAFYCFSRSLCFEDAVRSAVYATPDTDTNAAVAGALAGAYYGIYDIYQYYIDNVENKNMLVKLDELLWERSK